MEMRDAIVARRSVRNYTGEPLKESLLEGLTDFIAHIKPLHDHIPVDVELYEREDFVKDFARASLLRGNYFVVIRSARNISGYLQNVGFIGEQIVLWLTGKGIGSCWIGLCKQKKRPARGELPYMITIQFGRGDNAPFRRLPEEAPRKKLHELMLNTISRPEFLRPLEAGRLAPSAMNWQPVRYFTVDDKLYICRIKPPLGNAAVNEVQQIDVGIAMANMFVECDGRCTFVKQSAPPTLPEECLYEYTMLLKE